MTIKIPLWATLFTLAGIIVLCALGTWQIKRLAWKNNIIENLNAAYASGEAPINFETMKNQDFAYGTITGTLSAQKAFAFGHRVDEKQGAGHSLIIPLETDQGTLLINMGFNAGETLESDHTIKRHNNTRITINGLTRPPSWNSFTPQNDPENNKWYRYDIEQIAQTKDLEKAIPFILYADKTSIRLGENLPNNTRWYPKNNHAQYAFFWFALATSLIVIYILRFIRKPG